MVAGISNQIDNQKIYLRDINTSEKTFFLLFQHEKELRYKNFPNEIWPANYPLVHLCIPGEK